MLAALKDYGMFVTINNGRIVAYDVESDTKEIDWSSVGIVSSADKEFAQAICEALDIKDIEKYGVRIQE